MDNAPIHPTYTPIHPTYRDCVYIHTYIHTYIHKLTHIFNTTKETHTQVGLKPPPLEPFLKHSTSMMQLSSTLSGVVKFAPLAIS